MIYATTDVGMRDFSWNAIKPTWMGDLKIILPQHGTRGKLVFLTFYIIPLANKLKECGVFGVSSVEYLPYALQNRSEWEQRGEDLVVEMVKGTRRRDFATQSMALITTKCNKK